MRVDPGGGDGFDVDPAQLGGVAGQLGRAYDDFDQAITDYAGTACYAQSDFGDFGVGPAWANFDGAWAREMNVLGEALQELIQKVDTTAANYRDNEHEVAESFGKVGLR
ncbi:MAG TPA: type VII secretion target [Pseudonocardiaceae bacterium]|jgi:hypothetical protein|nr:type VII secretion target [Pseudonocardiaceae bacterium]